MMETVYQLQPHELTEDFFKSIQALFGDKAIKITIEAPHDETAFLLQHEVNRKLLLKELEAIKQGAIQHTLTLEEVDALAP